MLSHEIIVGKIAVVDSSDVDRQNIRKFLFFKCGLWSFRISFYFSGIWFTEMALDAHFKDFSNQLCLKSNQHYSVVSTIKITIRQNDFSPPLWHFPLWHLIQHSRGILCCLIPDSHTTQHNWLHYTLNQILESPKGNAKYYIHFLRWFWIEFPLRYCSWSNSGYCSPIEYQTK